MLPVYDEIHFLEILDKGGRNKPWLVRVNIGSSYENYVIKLFEDDPANFYTASEVYGSILAGEFDLPTPEIALFDINLETVSTFPPELQLLVEEKGAGIKFGSKYIAGALPFVPSLHKNIVQKRIEIDTLFAFDQLINNKDRNINRPNVLVLGTEIILIDHELAFTGLNADAIKSIANSQPINPNYHHHIAFGMLKSSIKTTKKTYFDTFQELLRNLNVHRLDQYEGQLSDLAVPTGGFGDIKTFLEFAKENHDQFVITLKGLIT